MPEVQTLKAFVQQRLSVAAEEIFELFERTIAEYEETLCRQGELLDAVFKPQVRLHRADVQLLSVNMEEVPAKQEWSPHLDQGDQSEVPHIKEEQVELWTNQDGEQLQGFDEDEMTKFTASPVPVKSDDGEISPSSGLHHIEKIQVEVDGEDRGVPEPNRNICQESNLLPFTFLETSNSSHAETDLSCDWKGTSEPQSDMILLNKSEEPDSNTGKTPVCSSECASSIGHEEHLQEHSGIQTGLKPFTCSICGKKYNSKNSLTTHMRLHSEGRSISCLVCKKTFPFRANLLLHMRVHTGEKPYCCSVCGSKFTQNNHLKKHRRIHTGEKPFGCSVCGRSFGQNGNLMRHMKIHTGEKPFSCSVCGRRFEQNGCLTRHMRIHTGEKPFGCSVCGRRFEQSGCLTRHMRIHTGEKPFSCRACERSFTQISHLKQHKCTGESSGSK